MNERIASGEIFVGLDDEAALAGLRRVEADFERTMAKLEREEATIDLNADLEHLKRDLDKAKAEVKKYEAFTKAAENKRQRARRETHLAELQRIAAEKEAELNKHRSKMSQSAREAKAAQVLDSKMAAMAKREQERQRILEAALRRRFQQERTVNAATARFSKQREREMASAHRDALRMNQDLDNQALAVARLQRQYQETYETLQRLNRENQRLKGRLLRTPAAQQKVDLNIAEAQAKMTRLQAELHAMGARPITQEVNLDIDRSGVGMMNRWVAAITEATIRIGPFTTTVAGLSRALLLLGPILSGLVGQASAFVGVLGAGVVGAAGVAAGALGALGLSLGGVGFLMGGLVDEFKALGTIQKAYRTAVLKYGEDSDQAKTKLKQFNNALGEVPPTTRRAFLSLDALGNRWNRLSQEAKPVFFEMLGESIETINHQFDWFRKNTLNAFTHVERGWQRWMEGLRSGEADRILAALGRNGNKSIEPLMEGLGNLATAFGRVAVAFSHHLPGLLRGFVAWSQGLEDASGRTDRLERSTNGVVAAMRAVGRLTAAVGRVITAFFSPGVDDGTEMINGWADGLNRLARHMRGEGRGSIDQWFSDSIALANQFWRALKPIAELFFEWTTIMRPFTVVALDVFRVMGQILQTMLDFGPTRAVLVGAFGIFLAGAVLKRVIAMGTGLWSIAKAIAAIKAAGGIGAALKGGVVRFLTGGLRGQTPANPLFVANVTGGMGPGAPGRGGRGAPVGGATGGSTGLLGRLPGFARAAGGVGLLAGAIVGLTKAADSLNKRRGLKELDRDVQKLVGRRDMKGLLDMKKHLREFGGNADDFIPGVERGIKILQKLNDQDLNRMTKSIDRDYSRLRNESNVTFKRVSGLAKYHFDLIENTMTKGSAAARLAASRNFNRAKDAIKSAMKAGTISTERGLDLIEKLWADAMAVYGFSRKQALAIRKGTRLDSGPNEGASQRAIKPQKGALVQVGRKGQVGPDSVPMNLGGQPAVVAPGEQIAVFNRHQQKKFAQTYPGGLEGFFSGPQRPHAFQGGGIVNVPGFPGERAASHILDEIAWVARTFGLVLTDAFGPGHKSPGHTIYGTAADFSGPDRAMDAAVRALVGQGYLVGYDGRFGSQAWPDHGPSYVAGRNAHLHVEFGGKQGNLTGGLAPEIQRVIMQTNLGLMSAVGQRALDTAHAAANANLKALAEAALAMPTAGGHGVGPGAGAATRRQMVQWATMALNRTAHLGHGGATAANIAKILELAMKESSWIVDSINNWDSNAAAGNPSGGLMHVTIDKVGGSRAALFDPVINMIASIKYQMDRYGQLITHSPYARGGLVLPTMGEKEWARGGKIERPTLMTGEDGKKAPEFVIGTNPRFKNSNLEALSAAASALGVPQARKSKSIKPTRKPRYIRGEGKEVDKLDPIQDYRKEQRKEEDTTRQISIETSKIQEPDSFIMEVGKDSDGNSIYRVDEAKVTQYEKQLRALRNLWDKLIGKKGIMERLAAAADRAYARIHQYINARQKNIADLDKTIVLNRKLKRSKDDQTARWAERRLERAERMKESERSKIEDARAAYADIREDQHDAKFRVQEYGVDRAGVEQDRAAVAGRAAEEAATANPEPQTPEAPTTPTTPETEGPTLFEQIATLSQARSDLLTQMGSNLAPVTGAISREAFGTAAIRSGAFAVGQMAGGGAGYQAVVTSQAATGAGAPGGSASVFGPSKPAWYQGPREPGMRYAAGAMDSGGGINIENINFPVAPSDPHTFSKALSWELGALAG